MKINFAYVAMKLNDDVASVYHMVLYEDKPTTEDIVNMLDELSTNEEFGLVGKNITEDYDIYFFEGEKLDQVRTILNIPDEINENGVSNP